jgi:hypothetical protein
MKNILLSVFILSVVSSFGQTDKESQYLLSLHKKKFTWLLGLNYDSLNALMDDNILYIHSNGLTETKSDVIANLKNEVISYTKSDVTESSVRLFASTAIITGKGVFAGLARGTPFELNLSYTEVYVRISGKWRLVSRHACRLPA